MIIAIHLNRSSMFIEPLVTVALAKRKVGFQSENSNMVKLVAKSCAPFSGPPSLILTRIQVVIEASVSVTRSLENALFSEISLDWVDYTPCFMLYF